MSKTLLVLLSAFVAVSVAGCCRIARTSGQEDLKTRVTRLEQRVEDVEKNLQLAQRLATMEARVADLARGAQAAPQRGVAAPSAAEARPGGPAQPAPAAGETTGPAPAAASVPATRSSREHPERYGGTYRQSIGVEPPNIDPAHISDTTSHRVATHLFEGLVEFSEDDLSVRPSIARSWEISPDGTVFTFKLRDDVKFHNGRLCTAADFVYSFARLLEPKTASERVWLFEEVLGYRPFAALLAARGLLRFVADGQFEKVELPAVEEALGKLRGVTAQALERAGVPGAAKLAETAGQASKTLEGAAAALRTDAKGLAKLAVDRGVLEVLDGLKVGDFVSRGLVAVDATTLRITLGRPFAPFLAVLAMPNASAVPKEVAEQWGDLFGQHAVGTGPFKLTRWHKQVSLDLDAFEDYFRGRPYLDHVQFRILPDDMARLNEFEIGNLDSITEIPDTKYEPIRATPNYPGIIQEMPTLYIASMGFNCTRKPFDDKRVRQAFNHAIRRDVILNVIRRGRGILARGILPPGLPAYDPTLPTYDYNPARARELLKEAGYDDPAKLGPIEYWYNATGPNDPNSKLAEVIQQNLRELGVEVKLQSTEWGTYLKKMERGELAFLKTGWVADYPDPDNFLYVLFHTSMRGAAGNHSYYTNPEVDALLERGRTSMDPKVRLEVYRKTERLIVADAPWLPLYHPKQVYMHQRYVKDAKLSAMGPDAMRLRHVWLDRSQMPKGN